MVDPRTPVLIGAGQLSNRVDKGATAVEPVDLIAEALRRAADDSGAGAAALTGADTVHIVGLLSWRYRDPGLLVADADRRDAAHQHRVGDGRQQPAVARQPGLPGDPARRGRPRPPRRRRGVAHPHRAPDPPASTLDWTVQGDDVPEAAELDGEVPMSSPGEQARGVFMPVQVYPLFEQAHRINIGRGLDEHLVAVSELWSRFSEVASHQPARVDPGGLHARGDPHPAARQPDDRLPVHEADELEQRRGAGRGRDPLLRRAGRGARRAPRSLGVPAQRHRRPRPLPRHRARRPRRVAGHAPRRAARPWRWPASASTTSPTSTSTPASRRRCRSRRRSSGSAPTGPLTVTGGLSFAGGPWNNYVMHSIATMAARLREDPGAVGPRHRQRRLHHQARLRRLQHRAPRRRRSATPSRRPRSTPSPAGCSSEEPDGEVAIETWTAMHDREGQPETGHRRRPARRRPTRASARRPTPTR